MKYVKKRAVQLCAVLLVFVLAACGANVDTTLTVDGNFSGTRVMVCELSNRDLEDYVNGGLQALQACIQGHLPQPLSCAISQDDSCVTAVFTLAFSSLEDYRAQVTALLQLSDPQAAPVVLFENHNSLFKRGVLVQESFTSADLLGWLQNALQEDGVVDPLSSADSYFAVRNTTLAFDGQEYASAGGALHVDEMESLTMGGIDIVTTLQEDGTFDRTITYEMDRGTCDRLGAELDAFMEQCTPAGALMEKTQDENRVTWSLAFTAADEADMVAKTNQALAVENTQFHVQAVPHPDKPACQQVSVTQLNDGSVFCDYTAGAPVVSTLVLPAGYEYDREATDAASPAAGASAEERAQQDGAPALYAQAAPAGPQAFTLVFSRPIPLEVIRITTDLDAFGGLEREIRYVLSAENAQLAGSAVEDLVRPGGQAGFVREEGDGTVEYVVTMKAQDAGELAGMMQAYLQGPAAGQAAAEPAAAASLDAGRLETDSFLTSGYYLAEEMDLAARLGQVSVVQGVEYRVNFPAGQRVLPPFEPAAPAAQSASGGAEQGAPSGGEDALKANQAILRTASLQIRVDWVCSGVSPMGVGALVLLAAGVLGAVLVLVRNRSGLAAWAAARRQARAARVAAAPAAPHTAPAGQPAAWDMAAPQERGPAAQPGPTPAARDEEELL